MEPIERFNRMWTPDAEGCHIWQGSRDRYGRFKFEGKLWLAHRWLFQHAHGYLPPEVCHACDKGLCVNERHLFPGTHLDNMNDRDAKRRRAAPIGEMNPNAKITREAALMIRSAAMSRRDLARRFGISYSAVCNIKTGRSWV